MEQSTLKSPKVFISYSWTSEEHKMRVKEWADRLIDDGIAVIIDIYDLKEGHDIPFFMEKMVLDPEITHVLVISDKEYSEKANNRKTGSGVGTEAQIISSEVYGQAQQEKFIPIFCERDEEGKPCLPVFMKSRAYIDFSSLELVNDNWEQLVRRLYGKPFYEKPALGKPPAYITEAANTPSNPAIAKFNSLKDALLRGKNPIAISHCRNDFLDSCFEYADKLRVRVKPETDDQNKLSEKLVEDCRKLKSVRTLLVEWILLEGKVPSEDFRYSLTDFLEKLPDLKYRPDELKSYREYWFDAHVIFVYETFLYIIAALLKIRSYRVLHEIFTHRYLPTNTRASQSNDDTFECFYGYSELLKSISSNANGDKYYSATAELIRGHADVKDIPFSSIIEADLVVLLMACLNDKSFWFPQTLRYVFSFYGRNKFPLFLRAEQHQGFLNLAEITGINDADELRRKIHEGNQRFHYGSYNGFSGNPLNYLYMDKWDTLK